MIKIKRGLDLRIEGQPEQVIHQASSPGQVSLMGDDFIGIKPSFAVKLGDYVKEGQLLFTDKLNPKVHFTSPASGKIIEINRGLKRSFQSIVIKVEGKDAVEFTSYSEDKLTSLGADKVKELMLSSGIWTSLRQRPFEKIAHPDHEPHSIFVTAIDTRPLCPQPHLILKEHHRNFINGLKVLSQLTKGKIYLCKAPEISLPGEDLPFVKTEQFSGPHPAGLVGTHIHFLDPAHAKKTVWHIGYQDVWRLGQLFTRGRLSFERVISLAGLGVQRPRLLRTQIGASIEELIKMQLKNDQTYRVISGSLFSGRNSLGPVSYLGYYHYQVTVIPEGYNREFLGWLSPGLKKYSVKNVFLSSFIPSTKINLNTNLNGSERGLVPIGSYEKVMPLDIEPTALVRSLITHDTDQAQLLGCLELNEEDVSLLTFVCPSKYEYETLLRENLNFIEKNG